MLQHKTVFAFEEILKSIQQDEYKSTVEDAILSSGYSMYRIFELERYVKKIHNKLEEEDESLRALELEYNKSYAVKYPGCVDRICLVLKQIKSSVTASKHLMERLSPLYYKRKDRYGRYGEFYPSKVAKSFLNVNGVRQYSLNLENMFRPEVEGLILNISKFLELVVEDIELCFRILREEHRIGNSFRESNRRYEDFYKEIEDEFSEISNLIPLDAYDVKNNPVLKARLRYDSFSDFVKGCFHKFSTQELRMFFFLVLVGLCKPLQCSNEELKESLSKIKGNEETGNEFYVNDEVDTLISEFDVFVPPLKKGKPTKITAETLAYFALAVGVRPQGCDISTFHKYFIRKYEPTGTLKVGQYSNFNATLDRIYLDGKYEDNATYKKFCQRLEELNQKKKSNIIKLPTENRISS